MTRPIQIGLLSVAFALATGVVGWLAVPVLAVLWGLAATRRDRHAALVPALSAGLGWLWLLMWTAFVGPAGELAHRTAGVMEMPTAVFVVATLVFPMLLAWAAAAVGRMGAAD